MLNPIDVYILRKNASRIIFNYDDAIVYSDERPNRYSRLHFIPFKRTVCLSDMVLVDSSYLADKAKPFNSNVVVLPLELNTADYIADTPVRDDKIRLVWISSESTLGKSDTATTACAAACASGARIHEQQPSRV